MYKKVTANSSNSDIGYLNGLVDGYNSDQLSVGKKLVDANWSGWCEEIESQAFQ